MQFSRFTSRKSPIHKPLKIIGKFPKNRVSIIPSQKWIYHCPVTGLRVNYQTFLKLQKLSQEMSIYEL